MADVAPAHVAQAPVTPAWADVRVRWKPTVAVLLASLLVGLIADQALRTGRFGLGATLTIAAGAVAVVTVGRLERIESRLLVAAAAVFGIWFTLRASPWLLWPDLAAVLVLLGMASSLAPRGSIFDLGAAELGARAVHSMLQLAAGAGFAAGPALHARGRMRAALPVLRGLLIALPIAAVIGGLLASADPVFASFFNLNVDFSQLVLDLLFVAVGALAAAGLLRLAASEPIERVDGPAWRLGATETLVVLAVMDTVFLVFAAAQVIAALGAAADTLRSAGITYSDYARSGFFQLLWVAGITLGVLILFSRIGQKSRLTFAIPALIAIALTLMIDVVAFRRLSLYEEAYGFTMLRLYSHVFAVWLAAVFILLALDFAGLWSNRRWFLGATLASGLVVLLGLNVANPEAVVVAFNTNHAQATHKIDAQYLADLSNDATPTLLASRSEIDTSVADQVTVAACTGARAYGAPWAAFNLADLYAADARHTAC